MMYTIRTSPRGLRLEFVVSSAAKGKEKTMLCTRPPPSPDGSYKKFHEQAQPRYHYRNKPQTQLNGHADIQFKRDGEAAVSHCCSRGM